ncbi:MAG: hypothetical protein ACI9W2_000410 [Gammaproteobacteria bacterium]|jgi:uncharacterized protein YdiU (UPF0061 family)
MNVPAPLLESVVFDNTYARLPERFFAKVPPTPSPQPRMFAFNQALANELGLTGALADPALALPILSGQELPPGAEPLAMAYAGHQFGGFAPQLGDGRAVLLGELIDRNGQRRDLQLKGSGRTPFSRSGDGRAVLGPVLREYVVSEAMHALGVPTTRALAAVLTGETVMRERNFPGAMLTRVSSSHIRVGTFEFFAARGDTEALRALADYVIARHYPELAKSTDGTATPYGALLQALGERQAKLVAHWMRVGFIHGVMNTDNTHIAGDTIDYGPCAFMDNYDPKTVYSFIDRGGRYAYGNQPQIAHWNLACFARALLPILDTDEEAAVEIAKAAIEPFPDHYKNAWEGSVRSKLGLEHPQDEDLELAQSLLALMTEQQADFTLTFRHLSALQSKPGTEDERFQSQFADASAPIAWLERWRARLEFETRTDDVRNSAMQSVNPAYIARNHLVEEAIEAALQDDFGPFERLHRVLQTPFDEQDGEEKLAAGPRPNEVVQQTFCGT